MVRQPPGNYQHGFSKASRPSLLSSRWSLALSPAASLWMAQSVPESYVNSCLPIERALRERILVPSLSEGLCRQKSNMNRCLTYVYVRRALQA